MADELRNEVAITLNGKEYTMRATFGAVRAIEKELGKSIIALTADVRDLSVTNCVTVVFHGIRGGGDDKITLEEVGNGVIAAGVQKSFESVAEFMLQVMNGVSLGKPEEAGS